MEAAARFVKVQLPNYLRSLPVPNSFSGCAQLTSRELVQLAPLVIVTSVAVYVVLSAIIPARKKKDSDWVNKDKQKEKPKVADVVEIEDLGEKTSFCRCWKSKKVSGTRSGTTGHPSSRV